MKKVLMLLSVLILIPVLSAQEKKILTVEQLIDMKRLDAPSVSPDGNWIVYNVRQYSLNTNTYASNIFMQSIDGKTVKQMNSSSYKDLVPTWSPDGRSIAFVSNRSGSYQIYVMALDGGEPRRVTNISTGVSAGNNIVWSPDGRSIAFTSDVYADCDNDDCNRAKDEAREASKVKAQMFDKLPFRVWDSWKDGKRSQLFIADVASGKTSDRIQGDYDVPPIDLGGSTDFCFSPDGKTIAFTMNIEPNIAWSTNNDIFIMPASGGEPKKISVSKGSDNQPVYSPDGKYLAFRSMKRAGYEADKQDLVLYETATGQLFNLTEKWDRSVGEVRWAADSKTIYFDSEDQGYHPIYKIGVEGGTPQQLTGKNYDQLAGVGNGRLVLRRQTMNQPAELFTTDLEGKNAQQLTNLNTEKLSAIEMNAPEEFWFEGAGKAKVHGFLVKPPKFDPNKKYPMLFLVHGGPQGAWSNNWHYRWNPQLFAAPGYVAVMINPRGSTGYGQAFTDGINKDWGGKVYEDLMKGLDYVIANYKFVDKDRIGAAGGSFGGYMMNWMNGHTDRFKCFISHSGIMNKYNMYGGTEEMWFEEWEMGGPYWEGSNKQQFEKWSPMNYVQNFKTPTLVIHGELDFRVPVMEGINLFQVLQRKGVPSKFLYFPDEGHWIMKPQNSQLWYHSVHEWFDQWLGKTAR